MLQYRTLITVNVKCDIDDIFVKCNCVDTRWQWCSTQLHTYNVQNNTIKQNTQNRTYITVRILKRNKKNK